MFLDDPDDELVPSRPGPLGLRGSIAMEGRNERADVSRLESALGATGHINLAETDGATGFMGQRLDQSIRRFQKDNGLRQDGLVNPGGPTEHALAGRLSAFGGLSAPQPAPRPRRRTQVTAAEFSENGRTVDGMLKSTNDGIIPDIYADEITSRGAGGRAAPRNP